MAAARPKYLIDDVRGAVEHFRLIVKARRTPRRNAKSHSRSASCSCCNGDQKKYVMTEPIVTNITDVGSTVRSFHDNCESQPVKQSR